MQVCRPENIPALVKVSSTAVKLPATTTAPIYVKFGGQMYFATSDLNLSGLSSLTAFTMYYIYLVLNGSTLQLVSSTNVNSVGPGYTWYRLVGAFISDGSASSVIGSFVNIVGRPSSEWISFTPVITNGGTVSSNAGKHRRGGDSMEIQVATVYTSTGAAGLLVYNIPTNITMDTAKLPLAISNRDVVGHGMWIDGGTGFKQIEVSYNGVSSFTFHYTGSSPSEFQGGDLANGDSFFYNSLVPISGWSNTQLKDL